MAGGWVGSTAAGRISRAGKETVILALACMALFCAALITSGMFRPWPAALAPWVFLVSLGMSLAAGLLAGCVYALAAATTTEASAAGRLYAADHLGAALGGFAASALFIPILAIYPVNRKNIIRYVG